jgi:hypothetical protein
MEFPFNLHAVGVPAFAAFPSTTPGNKVVDVYTNNLSGKGFRGAVSPRAFGGKESNVGAIHI